MRGAESADGATGPIGVVPTITDAATRRVPGSAASRARAWARWASRSPRFEPSATKTRSVDVGEPAGQVAQHGGHLLQIAGGALEIGEALGRLDGARGDVVGLDAVLSRDAGDRIDALAQPRERLILFSGCRRDPPRMGGRFRRGRDDRVERFERG